MQNVKLGRTGLSVGAAGLGCGGHSRLGLARGHDEAHAVGIVEHALDLGINFIDTASVYGTEEVVGKAIRGKRDRVVLSTKSIVIRGDRLATAAELEQSLSESLSRLGTDYVDVFHLHGVSAEHYPHCVEVLVPEMERQRDAGKIRFLGITEGFRRDPSHRMLEQAVPDEHFDVIMVGFSMLNPSARRTVFPHTRSHDVGTLIMYAVRRALSQPNELHALIDQLVQRGDVDPAALRGRALEFVSEHSGVTSLVQAAYRFCRHEPGARVVLTGTSSASHLTENVASINAPPLPRDVLDRLDEIFGSVDSVSGN
jgi:aryl-alcohol dehydrogenase-like predicted oxidoreductase